MTISFQQFDVQQFRTEIAKMSDAELVHQKGAYCA
jgi:hypothetical protein